MAMTPEAKVKAAVDRILKRNGVWYVKPVSSGMGKHGVPDYLCCFKGHFLGIECKGSDKGKPTPLQEIQMGLIHAAGGATYVATPGTLAGLDTWLEEMNTATDYGVHISTKAPKQTKSGMRHPKEPTTTNP